MRVRPRRATMLGVHEVKLRGSRAAPPSKRPSTVRAPPRRPSRSDGALIQTAVVQSPLLTATTTAAAAAARHPSLPRRAPHAAGGAAVGRVGDLLVGRRGGRLIWWGPSRHRPERRPTPLLPLPLQLLLVLHELLAQKAPGLQNHRGVNRVGIAGMRERKTAGHAFVARSGGVGRKVL